MTIEIPTGARVTYRLCDSPWMRTGTVTGRDGTAYLIKVDGRDWTDRMYANELRVIEDRPDPREVYTDEQLDQIDAWERDREAYALPERDDEIMYAGEDGQEP